MSVNSTASSDEFLPVGATPTQWEKILGANASGINSEMPPICLGGCDIDQAFDLLVACKDKGGLFTSEAAKIGPLIDAHDCIINQATTPTLMNVLSQLRVRLSRWDATGDLVSE